MLKQNFRSWAFLLILSFLTACFDTKPKKIFFGQDQCEHCKMSIVDPRFATQIVTDKGKAHKFDSIECMLAYAKNPSNSSQAGQWKYYVPSFKDQNQWLQAEEAHFSILDSLKSPMGLGILAGSTAEEMRAHQSKILNWAELKSFLENQKEK